MKNCLWLSSAALSFPLLHILLHSICSSGLFHLYFISFYAFYSILSVFFLNVFTDFVFVFIASNAILMLFFACDWFGEIFCTGCLSITGITHTHSTLLLRSVHISRLHVTLRWRKLYRPKLLLLFRVLWLCSHLVSGNLTRPHQLPAWQVLASTCHLSIAWLAGAIKRAQQPWFSLSQM